jgi:hypothetical protein
VIARVALREPDLPRMDAAHLDADLQLLVGARDQLVDEQARMRNRLHALLLGLTAGHREVTGALISQAALRRARSLVLKGRGHDPVRAKLALAAIRRLHALTAEIKAMEADIAQALRLRRLRPHTHLMAIPELVGHPRVHHSGLRTPQHNPRAIEFRNNWYRIIGPMRATWRVILEGSREEALLAVDHHDLTG